MMKTRKIPPTEAHWTKPTPLGLRSGEFQTKKNSKGAILDQPNKGTIELYPAGYTKPSTADGVSRQVIHRAIYHEACTLKTQDELYPFGKSGSHWIELIPLADNPHDPNAIMIRLCAGDDSPLSAFHGRDLGFIPGKISKEIRLSLSMFTGGVILKTRSQVHDKYWQCKVVLSYGDMMFSQLDQTARNRFAAIMGE